MSTPPGDKSDFQRIDPVKLREPGTAREPDPVPRQQRDRPLVWGAILATVLLACLVVLWLPGQLQRAETAGPETAQTVPSGDTPAHTAAPKSPADDGSAATQASDSTDTEAVLERRRKGQRLADALQLRRAELEKRAVQRWAEADYAKITAIAKRAQDFFDARDFEAAASEWRSAVVAAEDLLKQVEPVLKSALVQGHQHLEAGDSEAAVESFDLALAIHPDNALAKMGMRRAKNLDEVLALLAAAENHERDEQFEQAQMLYREALSKDPQSKAAREGLKRVMEGMAEWEFRITLSTAQQALDRGDYAAARQQFLLAEKLKSGDPAVAEGLAQAEAGLQQQQVDKLRAAATSAEENEQWQKARDNYRELLKLDDTLQFAQRGQARASERLALDQSLVEFIEQPRRLYSEPVRRSAQNTLAQARAVAQPGERLRRQMAELEEALQLAQRKIPVRLQSDNATNVMVYQVGKLGRFEQRDLQLTPGDYVVIGRCEGYRDVRKTIVVQPDMRSVGPIMIRCTERI